MMDNSIDPEDVIHCQCYVLLCCAKDGRWFSDRVYKSKELAIKRRDYLNGISGGRGEWGLLLSELSGE